MRDQMADHYTYLDYAFEGEFLNPGHPELGPEAADKAGYSVRVSKPEPAPESLFRLVMRVNKMDIRAKNVTFDLLRDCTLGKAKELVDTAGYRKGADLIADLLDYEGNCTLTER